MANIKSAQKQARQNIIKRQRNLARRTAIKTALKKVLHALDNKVSGDQAKDLLREAEAKLARAKNKGVVHARTASRKISRLAQRLAKTAKAV